MYIYPSLFAEAFLHFFNACCSEGKIAPWGAEPRFQLRSAIQQASALPTELRCTLSYAAHSL